MKTLIVSLVLLLAVIFLGWHVAPCLTIESMAAERISSGGRDAALRAIDEIARRPPCLCRESARELASSIALEGAELELQKDGPGFELAATWVDSVSPASSAYSRARQIRTELPGMHLQFALGLTRMRLYDDAIEELRNARRLYPADTLSLDAERHEAIARFRRAQVWTSDGRAEDALGELMEVAWDPKLPALLAQSTRQQVPLLLEEIVNERLLRHEYMVAFRLLDEAVRNGVPAANMHAVVERIDRKVFGAPLHPAPPFLLTPIRSRERTSPAEVELVLRNRTGHRLRVSYRGPKSLDVTLPRGGAKTVRMPAGDFVVGAYNPDIVGGTSLRTEALLRPGAFVQVFQPPETSTASRSRYVRLAP